MPAPSLIFATHNQNKVKEIQAAIGNLVKVTSLEEAGITDEIPEPHDTLEQNASEKSWFIYRKTGLSCFSEDTGLEVEALGGEPGVFSARYAGEEKDFKKNIDKLLDKLKNETNRRARFRTIISLIWEGRETRFEGISAGTITRARRGSSGFGYDPVFIPDDGNQTFAELTLEEKNAFSHRKKAADKLVIYLQHLLPRSPENPE